MSLFDFEVGRIELRPASLTTGENEVAHLKIIRCICLKGQREERSCMHAYSVLAEVVPIADILVQSGEKRWASHLTYNSAIRDVGYEYM